MGERCVKEIVQSVGNRWKKSTRRKRSPVPAASTYGGANAASPVTAVPRRYKTSLDQALLGNVSPKLLKVRFKGFQIELKD
jgi:hypothetical protein